MLKLKKELFEQIVKQCAKEFPNEACGILCAKNNIIEKVCEMTNADKSPYSYFMDAKEQFKVMKEIRNSGQEMTGIYHSHVASDAYPSARDVQLAFYPDASYAIVSLKNKNNPSIRSFKIKEGKIIEEAVEIV